MAVTGLMLFGFVVGHLIGNLQLLGGPDPINKYAKMLHDLGPLLWVVRFGLLAVFSMHVVTRIRLARQNRLARPVPYSRQATIEASYASRSMVLTGVSTLAFVVYHLLHFTVDVTSLNPAYEALRDLDGEQVKNVYGMVVASFSAPGIAIAYIAFQIVLFFHLAHGVQSLAQTLGLHHARYTPMIRKLSWLIAAAVAGGNIFLVLAVLTGIVPAAA